MRIRNFTQRNLLMITLACLLPMLAFAQKPDRAPEPKPQNVSPIINTQVGAEKALWDLQFSYDVSTDHGEGSMSNGFFLNGEFWIAEWNSDFIARYDADGTYIDNFVIPGLSGTRSITTDGTNVYIANNGSDIFTVDFATQTIVSTAVSDAADGLRWITYDETIDGGNGGFWAGNFNTPIYELDLNGTVLSQIDPATHTLGGMYGAAVDTQSPGGPYLWVFSQAGAPIDAVIYQLQMPAGTPTGVGRNVELDLGVSGTLAGGLFITDEYDTVNGTMTIGGVIQGTPDIAFGYELTFAPGPNINPGVTAINSPVTACGLSTEEVVSIEVVNNGTEELTDIPVTLFVNGEEIVTENVPGPLASGATTTYDFAMPLDMSVPGLYFFDVLADLDTDVSNVNNLATGFAASKAFDTDVNLVSVFEDYMPEDFIFDGLYNEGDITFFCWDTETSSDDTGPSSDASGSGNFIYMEASGFDPGDQAVLSTDCLDLTDAESVTLSFFYHMYGAGIGSLTVNAVNGAGQSVNVFQQNGQLQTSADQAWEASLLFIDDPNVIGETIEFFFTGTIGQDPEPFQCDIALDDINISKVISGVEEIATLTSMEVIPNPVDAFFTVNFDLAKTGENIRIQLFDNVGRQLDIINASNLKDGQFELNVEDYAPGIYHLQLTVDGQVATKKVVVQ